MVFFNLCKKLESYMNSMNVYRSMNQNDEEMEYNIRQFMDTILDEENEEEYTDYRKYFKYDMRILSRQDGEEPACFNAALRMFHVPDLHLLMRRFQHSRGRESSRW